MKTLGVILVLPFLIWGGIRVEKYINFGIECSGRMKRAADANSIELAKTEMQQVVKYLEDNKMTSGYTTALLWKPPSEDVGFFFRNMKESLDELEKMSPDATPLERSNMLMKLRETLLDSGQSTSVTYPNGLEIFPNNTGYAIFGCLSSVLAVVGVVIFVKSFD